MYLPSGDMAAVSTLPSFVTRVIFMLWKCAGRGSVGEVQFLNAYTRTTPPITRNVKTARVIPLCKRIPLIRFSTLKVEVGAPEGAEVFIEVISPIFTVPGGGGGTVVSTSALWYISRRNCLNSIATSLIVW